MLFKIITLALLATTTLAAAVPTPSSTTDLSPRSIGTPLRAEQVTCRTEKKCCTFNLVIYERCIPQADHYQGRVETWPLFYDFTGSDSTPLEPIHGDYNAKVCSDCDPKWVGNITGPDDFYLRWRWVEEKRGGTNAFWDVMNYWVHNPDNHYFENHRDRGVCNFAQGKWSEGDEDHRAWGDKCRFSGTDGFNRTRVSRRCCYYCGADC
jgi:hypothetical protein